MTIDGKQNGWWRRSGITLPQPIRAARSRRPRRAAAVLALVALTMLAPAGSIHAASQPAALQHLPHSFATLVRMSTSDAASVPAGAVQTTAVPGAGTLVRGVVRQPATPTAAAHVRPPITLPTPLPVLPSGSVTAPGLSPLQATTSSVTVTWSDQSTNELGFKVFRRDDVGRWRQVDQVASRDVRGTGDAYTWVDTSTDLSGQCYMIAAYNANAGGSSAEECTVRPDPRRFPLLVPGYAPEWSGLSATNDGTGALLNLDNNQQLQYAERTFGVNLQWAHNSLWRIEAQGGPHLMKGQAVALKVWGGGWLRYGNETWGVDLQLSSTPVYEWYVIGQRNDPADRSWAGSGITDGSGTFALWNSSAHAYLLASYQTWGVSLNWSNKVGGSSSPTPSPKPQGVKTVQVFNCTLNQEPAEVVTKDLTTGGGYVDQGTVEWSGDSDGFCPAAGSLPFTFSPQSGHQYALYVTQNALCDDLNPYPQDPLCIDASTSFVGGANGGTEPIVIHGGPPAPGP